MSSAPASADPAHSAGVGNPLSSSASAPAPTGNHLTGSAPGIATGLSETISARPRSSHQSTDEASHLAVVGSPAAIPSPAPCPSSRRYRWFSLGVLNIFRSSRDRDGGGGSGGGRSGDAITLEFRDPLPHESPWTGPDGPNAVGATVMIVLVATVREEAGFEVQAMGASLVMKVAQKKPYHPHCPDCATQSTEIKSWTFITQSTRLTKGVHTWPLPETVESRLLPSPMTSPLVSISYELQVELIPVPTDPDRSTTRPIRADGPLMMQQGVPASDMTRHSIRIFTPTGIKSDARYTRVINPTGELGQLSLRVTGLFSTLPAAAAASAAAGVAPAEDRDGKEPAEVVEFWRPARITWHIEESLKVLAPACPHHAPSSATADDKPMRSSPAAGAGAGAGEDAGAGVGAGADGGGGAAVLREEKRIHLGGHTAWDGWKTDYDLDSHSRGAINFETTFGIDPLQVSRSKWTRDTHTDDGSIQISHTLVVEVMVTRELIKRGKPAAMVISQSRAGRSLRACYAIALTDVAADAAGAAGAAMAPFGAAGGSDDGGRDRDTAEEALPRYEELAPRPPEYREPVELEELLGTGGGESGSGEWSPVSGDGGGGSVI